MSLKLVKSISPEDFRISASDTKGHSARQWFRCIPSMARQVEQTVQSRRFPYRTGGDVLRHALHRHMKWLTELEDIPSVTGQVDVILEIMRDDEANNDFTLVFEKLADRIGKHIDCGAQKEAVRLIVIIQNHINDMPDGFWKTKYQNELKRRYAGLLKVADKAKLGETD